jgi:hypothetical protein
MRSIISGSPGQAVSKEKMAALLRPGPLHFLKYLVLGEQIDIGYLPGNELFMSVAVEITGCRVGIHQVSGGRINQKHHRMVILEKAVVAGLAFPQVCLCPPALGDVRESGSA